MYEQAMETVHRAFCGRKAAGQTFCFLRAFCRAPLSVGSVCESSPYLTRALVAGIPRGKEGLIVDLGAGTGVVTRQLLQQGCSPDRIVAVEKAPALARIIRRTWPGLQVMAGDAVDALAALRRSGAPVSAVISSLPLRLFPVGTVSDMLHAVQALLPEGGRLIQYSYALWMRFPLRGQNLHPVSRTFVFGNLPPARVEVYACGCPQER